MICFGVKGADISIDGQENFEKLDMPAGQKLRSISLKNLDINEQFWEKWNCFNFDVNSLAGLSFDNCSFEEEEEFEFLIEFKPLTLEITNSGISDKNLISIMRYSDPYITKMILSGNSLGKDSELFQRALGELASKGGGLSELDVSGNYIDSSLKKIIVQLLLLFGSYYCFSLLT